jgi:hypothetical protein
MSASSWVCDVELAHDGLRCDCEVVAVQSGCRVVHVVCRRVLLSCHPVAACLHERWLHVHIHSYSALRRAYKSPWKRAVSISVYDDVLGSNSNKPLNLEGRELTITSPFGRLSDAPAARGILSSPVFSAKSSC